MQEDDPTDTNPHLRVMDAARGVFVVTSSAGQTIGHAVGGQEGGDHQDGPGLLVAGAGEEADMVFRRILDLPGIGAIEGRLVLLNMDRLGHPGDLAELDRLAATVRPITDTLFLPAVAPGNTADAAARIEGRVEGRVEAEIEARVEALFQTILGFCAQHGIALNQGPAGNRAIRSDDP